MKKSSLLILTAIFGGFTVLTAQENNPSKNNSSETENNAEPASAKGNESEKPTDISTMLDPTRENFNKLSDDKKKEFAKHMSDASRLTNSIRMLEALSSVLKAEAILSDSFALQNLKGAIYMKIRIFDSAQKCFEKAQKLFPEAFQPTFNLAEIEFVKHNFAQAEKMFEKALQGSLKEEKRIQDIINSLPANTSPFQINTYHNQLDAQAGTTSLLRFKLLCCKLKLKKRDEAEKYFAQHFNYMDETPAYWLGKMAFDLAKDKEKNADAYPANPQDNLNFRSARNIFPPHQIEIFVDSFREIDWIETMVK